MLHGPFCLSLWWDGWREVNGEGDVGVSVVEVLIYFVIVSMFKVEYFKILIKLWVF